METLLYESGGTFRRIFKNALIDKINSDGGVDKTLNELLKVSRNSISIGESQKFAQQITLVFAIQNNLKHSLGDDTPTQLLIEEILTNNTSIAISQGKHNFHYNNHTITDTTINAINKTVGWLSKAFGNAAGSIKWRTGTLLNNSKAINLAKLTLKPMDILIEKSAFVLTDKFIPGHFGHVAIYLGTKEQLQEIGMWNHPWLAMYQDQIESGKVILEAVRSGVRLNSLENFMNIDELTIMRKEDGLQNSNEVFDEITRGIDQIGKLYDFNFDISTIDKIVCSELIYIVYGNVRWQTKYRFGRPTITPDDVAEILFQKNTKFHIENIQVGNKNKEITLANLDYLASDLDYEMRASSGTKMTDKTDPSNSYWKKEVKCYTVLGNDPEATSFFKKHFCKTSFKQFTYEERNLYN